MKRITKILLGAATVATTVLNFPGVSDAVQVFLHAHPHAFWSILGLGILGALAHEPTKKSESAAQPTTNQ